MIYDYVRTRFNSLFSGIWSVDDEKVRNKIITEESNSVWLLLTKALTMCINLTRFKTAKYVCLILIETELMHSF